MRWQVYGWVPVPSSKVGDANEENYLSDVHVKCFGQTPADTENMNRTFYGADPANNPNFAGWTWVNGALVNATNMTVSSVCAIRFSSSLLTTYRYLYFFQCSSRTVSASHNLCAVCGCRMGRT